MKSTALFAVILCLGATAPAVADLSYSELITSEGAGGMAMLGSEAEIVTQISGQKSRTDSRITMKSKLANAFAGGGNSSDIILINERRSLRLLPDKKQYSVMTFDEARAQMEKSMQAMKNAQSSGGSGGALPVSAEGCQWTDGKMEVEHHSGTTKIAKIKTKQHTIRMNQSCTDPQTGKTCDITWLMDTWLAKKVPGEKEVRKFQEAYFEAMGLDDVASQVQGPGQGMLAMFADNWDEIIEEFEKMKGYPLRTVMQMGIGGEECTTASGQPIAMDDMWANASTAAYNAAVNQAGSEASSAVGRAAGEALGGSVAGSIGGAAVGAAAGELIGGLTGMFKKKKKAPEPQAQPVSPEDQQVTAFRITREVKKWSQIDVPPERFYEPTDWKKIKALP